jgi:hypothetical protein
MIGIKPITIEEHCFKILIPEKVILDYVFNDLVVFRFMSFCINGPRTTHVLVLVASGREASKMVEQKRNPMMSYRP